MLVPVIEPSTVSIAGTIESLPVTAANYGEPKAAPTPDATSGTIALMKVE